MRKCKLPSNTMVAVDEPTTPSKKKKEVMPSYPKCTLLARLGVDYLGQFSKHYQMDIDFTFNSTDGIDVLLEVVEKVIVDPKQTDSILSSITFYILSIKDKSDDLREKTSNILTQLMEITKLPQDLQWV